MIVMARLILLVLFVMWLIDKGKNSLWNYVTLIETTRILEEKEIETYEHQLEMFKNVSREDILTFLFFLFDVPWARQNSFSGPGGPENTR